MYNSPSGHAFMIGCKSGNVVNFGVLAKKCAKCSRATRAGLDTSPHVCSTNHEGLSGPIEAKLALKLTVELFEKKKSNMHLNKIINDNDSTMRSLLQHTSNHDKGKVPKNIPEPVFLADPSHRIKVMSKPFFFNG